MDCPDEDTIAAFVGGAISTSGYSSIEAHMDRCSSCSALVAEAAKSRSAMLETRATPTSGALSRGALAPSSRLGRYIVLEELGEGGMGRVYAAYDPELDRRIALKLLRPELAARRDPSMGRARLLREAQAMARLSHPNVLTVHDVGEVDPALLESREPRPAPQRSPDDEPLVFIAMEIVDGCDLRTWMNERPRSWREVLTAFVQAGEGLAAAHAAGLLHRDFKPDNVLLDDHGHVRVMDFGLARSVEERPSGRGEADIRASTSGSLDGSLTRTGTAMGTPAYMPPEQWTNAELDPRADQFAFCVSMWEALYGTRPFRGATEAVLRDAVSRGVIDAPNDRRGVPSWLHRAILRGLAPDREQRHPSMRMIVDELRLRPRRRRRIVVAGSSTLIVAAVGTLAYDQGRSTRDSACRGAATAFDEVWSSSRRTRIREAFAATKVPFADAAWTSTIDSLDAYRTRWVSRHQETCEATHLHGSQSAELLDLRMDCLHRQLTTLQALLHLFETADARVVEQAPLAAAGLVEPEACAQIETLRARAPADPQIRAQVAALRDELTRARVNLDHGRASDAVDVAERIVSEARDLDALALEAEALRTLGDALDRRGEVEQASTTLRKALVLAERAGDDELAASIWASLTFIDGYARGRTETGLLAADYAEAKLGRVGADPILQAQVDSNRASALFGDGRIEEATRHQRAAVDAITKARGDADLVRARFLTNLGAFQLASGDADAALVSHRTALGIQQAELGPDHPALVQQHGGLANVHYAQGRLAEARASLERGLAIIEVQPDPNLRELANLLNNLGNVLSRLGEPEYALERLEKALALRRSIVGHDNPDIAQSLDNIGSALLSLDRHEEALARHEEALALRLQTQGEDHPWLAYSLHGIGMSQLAAGDADAAIEALERALALRDETDAGDRGATEFALARALWLANREHARARELARSAHARMSDPRAGELSTAEQIAQWLTERGMQPSPLADSSRIAVDSSG